MMRQYREARDSLEEDTCFSTGDFFEMFESDANGCVFSGGYFDQAAEMAPMAGIPSIRLRYY